MTERDCIAALAHPWATDFLCRKAVPSSSFSSDLAGPLTQIFCWKEKDGQSEFVTDFVQRNSPINIVQIKLVQPQQKALEGRQEGCIALEQTTQL